MKTRITMAVAFILVILNLVFYFRIVPNVESSKITTIIKNHTDTIRVYDSIQKIRIKYIDTSKIIIVHDTLDALIAPSDSDGYQVIADNQLREAVKWKDSLNTCIDLRKVDSIAIDTLSDIANTKIAPPKLIDDAKKIGIGVLIGIAIKSLF